MFYQAQFEVVNFNLEGSIKGPKFRRLPQANMVKYAKAQPKKDIMHSKVLFCNLW